MSNEVKEKNNKLLVGALVGLIAVIVGLTVGIVAVNLNSGQQEIEQAEAKLPAELRGNNLSPTDQVIKETSIMLGDPNYSDSDIENYYEKVIDEALSSGDTDLAMRIIIQKMEFIAVTEGDCAKSKDYVNNVSLEPYSAQEKSYLASYVLSSAEGCEGGELQPKWQEIYGGR